MNSAFSKAFTTCAKSNLDFQNKSVLIQVSGGPDSIFLLHSFHTLFKKIIKKIEVLTIDFGLRKKSYLEADFVYKVCESLDISCHLVKAPLIKNGNVQKKAREFRLKKVEQIMKKNELDFTLMGHHQDDLLETLLLKLKRGAGLFSLTSFNVKRGKLIRPLINYSKDEILGHLQTLNLPYMLDPSNSQNNYYRNRIRNKIFPCFDENLKSWRSGFLFSYQDLNQANAMLREFVYSSKMIKIYQGLLFLTSKFMKLEAYHQQMVLKLYLKKMSIFFLNGKFLAEIRKKIIQKTYAEHIINGEKYASEKGVFYKSPPKLPSFTIGLEQSVVYEDNYFSFSRNNEEKKGLVKHPNDSKKKFFKSIYFALSIEVKNLYLRPTEHGDRLRLPNVGQKKIGNIFTDDKVPRLLRRLSLVIVIENDILAVMIIPIHLFDFFQKHKGLKRENPLYLSQKAQRREGLHKYVFTWQKTEKGNIKKI